MNGPIHDVGTSWVSLMMTQLSRVRYQIYLDSKKFQLTLIDGSCNCNQKLNLYCTNQHKWVHLQIQLWLQIKCMLWQHITTITIALPTHRVFADPWWDCSPFPADVNARTWHDTYSPAEKPQTVCDLLDSVSVHDVTEVLHLYCKCKRWYLLVWKVA